MAAEATHSEAAVLDVVEAQRQEIRQSASAEIGKVEDRRDRELRRLDQVAAVFKSGAAGVARERSSSTRSAPKPSRERLRRRKGRSAAAEARERREAIYRYLLEQGRPLAKGDIRQALRTTDFSTSSALKWLAQEGRVKRSGVGAATRYEARAEPAPDGSGLALSALSERAQGSAQGRILTMLEDRGSASLSELAQALRTPLEQVRKECGALIREEEIAMARRDGQPVYALQRAAA
jgi:hypothetical protein